jgi:hypothetical protein
VPLRGLPCLAPHSQTPNMPPAAPTNHTRPSNSDVSLQEGPSPSGNRLTRPNIWRHAIKPSFGHMVSPLALVLASEAEPPPGRCPQSRDADSIPSTIFNHGESTNRLYLRGSGTLRFLHDCRPKQTVTAAQSCQFPSRCPRLPRKPKACIESLSVVQQCTCG